MTLVRFESENHARGSMPRMNILNALEGEAHDTPPRFSGIERKNFFELPIALNHMVKSLRNPTNQVCFVLALSGFRNVN